MIQQQYVGPCAIDCPESCDVPAWSSLTVLNVFPEDVRHDWPDVVRCPNGCGRVFLIVPPEEES